MSDFLLHFLCMAVVFMACLGVALLIGGDPAHIASWIALSVVVGDRLRGMHVLPPRDP